MTAAEKTPEQTPAQTAIAAGLGRTFLGVILTLGLALLLAGAGGFWYLTANSPLALRSGGDRPIAAATAFVPSQSPLTFSLLTQPDRLIAFQQASAATSQREQGRDEVTQLKQTLLERTGLDYDRDIQPWIGSEVTFAFTDKDLDSEAAGAQPGYLVAMEIAPERQQAAREFLQLLWQRQSLAGNLPISERMSGVRLLYSQSKAAIASALVGDQLILFANDVRVLRHSIRASQTAMNLAQNRAYRETVAKLPAERIGLAYVDTASLGELSRPPGSDPAAVVKPSFAAIGLGLTRSGLVANARLAALSSSQRSRLNSFRSAEAVPLSEPIAVPPEALTFLPGSSSLALASRDLTQIAPALTARGIPIDVLPNFFQVGHEASAWDWATADYALGQTGSANDWILAVAKKNTQETTRENAGVARLDEVAIAQGYSAVPITLGEAQATAWTRFKAPDVSKSRRQPSSTGLETEILGLHLQQRSAESDYEIFASSLDAMESALAAPADSLLNSERFLQALAPLSQPNQGYFYADWSKIAPAAGRAWPAFNLISVAARPFLRHIDVISATRQGDAASFFIQLTSDD
ncbi:MAG: DUF3352 domain-containing protein [Phormidesmis sp.]